LKYGLLSDSGKKSRTGEPAYTTFAKGSVVFALKTQGGKIGGLYFRSVNDQGGRHFYLRDRKGLWPRWPEVKAKRLLLCESIIDAASVVQDERIQKAWSVLALYGTNGWTAEHTGAINRLDELEEICLMLDGDAAGKRATDTYAKKVRELWPSVQVTSVELPNGEDVNGLLVKSGAEVLAQAITDRCEVVFSSTDPSTPASFRMTEMELPPKVEAPEPEEIPQAKALDESNPYDLGYGGRAAKYRIKGYRVGQLDSLKVTLQIQVG
jgi:hypothetical protein